MKQFLSQLFGGAAANKPNPHFDWLDELGQLNDTSALQLSAKKLALLTDTEAINWQDMQQVLLEVEAHNQPHLDKLSAQIVNVENMKSELETSYLEICYQYCRQSFISHLKVIEKANIANNEHLELMLARTLNIAMQMVKWRIFAQSPPPAKVWQQIYVLYALAQHKNLLNQEVVLFEGWPATTLAASFAQTCMFGQLMESSCGRHQIEISNKLLTHWVTRVDISETYSSDRHVFYINLNEDHAARRVRGAKSEDNCRYWHLDTLEKQAHMAVTALERGETISSLARIKIDHPKHLPESLRLLLAEWGKSAYVRQRRREPRRATSKTAKVMGGIQPICEQIQKTNRIAGGSRISRDGRSLDELLLAHTALRQNIEKVASQLDTWVVCDESKRGLGMRASKFANVTAKPGKLISVSFDAQPGQITLAQIKGARATTSNQLRVSVEILSINPTWAQLQMQAHPDNAGEKNITHSAQIVGVTNTFEYEKFFGIYLPSETGITESPMLVLPKTNFLPNQYYSITINGYTQRAQLVKPVESMDDWVKVEFNISA